MYQAWQTATIVINSYLLMPYYCFLPAPTETHLAQQVCVQNH